MHPERLTYTFRFVVFRAAGDAAAFAQASGATADFLFFLIIPFFFFFFNSLMLKAKEINIVNIKSLKLSVKNMFWEKKKTPFHRVWCVNTDSCTLIQKYF